MRYRYNPYRDTFEHNDDETATTASINISTFPTPIIIKQVELTQSSIDAIAEAVVKKLREGEE